jgi:O-antigen/teichoic acid export membrane protein
LSRIANAKRNIRYGYINTLVSLFLKFLTRTVFIYTIGVTYLGVNGLFTNILSVLSLADLGISTALNFSLYKPVAQKDIQKIKALMQIFKKAYSIIAIVIAILGLSLLPFLSIFIKNPIGITPSELVLYYLLFLFNTVSTYFVSYKYSLANADQRNYIETNFQTATILVTSLVQVAVLLIFKSFLFYLLSATVIELFHKILVNIYLNKRYPYLAEQVEGNLTKEELTPIKRNIKALV